ncbi:hypothetical protein BC827DRAFT_1158106 [Russula dissimulans]|nr:hypothetical protein BC827DRAFT_1158106 [Russula dissimulans]
MLCVIIPDADSLATKNRPHRTSIDILDDDSLLNIFHLYRRPVSDQDEDRDYVIMVGGDWSRESWWYKLVHVCQRWRYLMLGSASYLGLSLVCKYDTPVAEMLEHAPPLPLVIDLLDPDRPATEKDHEGITLALEHRDRIRRIGLRDCVPLLSTINKALQAEFPILEHLVLMALEWQDKGLKFPKTFQAPRLRHLVIAKFIFPRRSPSFLRTAVGLVTLYLDSIHPSTCTSPNYILQQLSHMPQLENLGINFIPRLSSPGQLDVEEQSLPITTHVTLPTLRLSIFKGSSAYLEALLPHFTAPRLERLDISFCHSGLPTFSVPQLVRFVSTTENLKRRCRADLIVNDYGVIFLLRRSTKAQVHALRLSVPYPFSDPSAAFIAQTADVLRPIFSAVTDLNLFTVNGDLSGWYSDDHLNWRDVLRPFSNANSLLVHCDLVGAISRALRFGDEELPADLLPELRELACCGSDENVDAFAPFVDARKNADRPVTLIDIPEFDLSPRVGVCNELLGVVLRLGYL